MPTKEVIRRLRKCDRCLAKFTPRSEEQIMCRACAPRDIPQQSGDVVLCGCGCGKTLTSRDWRGRPRRFLMGHNDTYKTRHKPLLTCPICDRQFRSRHANQVLCSMDCRRERNKQPRPSRQRQVDVSCYSCGSVFKRKPSNVGERNFCQPSCKNEWMAEAYPQRITQRVRLARERDSSQCAICGFNEVVHVHHIIPECEGGLDSLDNLLTLCPNHHALADRGKIGRADLQAMIPPSPPLSDALLSREAKVNKHRGTGTFKGSSKLTEEQVIEMRRRHAAGGVTQVQLGEEFGVSGCTAHQIVTGKTWKYLLLPSKPP